MSDEVPTPEKPRFFFADAEQAALRLNNAVILFEGEPHYVQSVGPMTAKGPKVFMWKLPVNTNNPPAGFIEKYLTDTGFGKFQPINPGMINFFEGCPFTGRVTYHASYLDRIPVRRTKQGLARENTSLTNPKDEVDFRGAISSQSFCDMVQGHYPDYAEAVDSLVNDSSIAVTAKYSVGISGKGAPMIMKQTKTVGLFRGNNEILLYPKFMYLREEILEQPNLPNNISSF